MFVRHYKYDQIRIWTKYAPYLDHFQIRQIRIVHVGLRPARSSSYMVVTVSTVSRFGLDTVCIHCIQECNHCIYHVGELVFVRGTAQMSERVWMGNFWKVS